jgi:hypothetical protein
MSKTIIKKHNVENRNWVIAEYDDGTFSCEVDNNVE